MTSPVLDASALLAYLQGEPGGDRVREAIGRGATVSAVNWAETLSKLADAGEDPDQAARRLLEAGPLLRAVVVHPFDEAQAREAARLRPLTRSLGLSLGDRACLALGKSLGVPVLTADGSWAKLKIGVRVEIVR